MTNNSACLTLLVVLVVLGFTLAQLEWNKVTLSEEPNEDWIYYHRSMWAYNLPKGETFEVSVSLILGDEGNFYGFNYGVKDESGKLPGEDAPDPLMTSLHLQANFLLYSRDGTFLGGTNLFQLNSNKLKTNELGFGHEDEIEFYIEIPTCGLQRFTKSRTRINNLISPVGARGAKSIWSIINYASTECPEVFGAIQFATSRDQFDLDLHYKPYYRVENWKGGYVIYPFDEHNDFIGEDVITTAEGTWMYSIELTYLS